MDENMNHTSIAAEIMDVHDVATYLRLSETFIYKLVRAGCLPGLRMGKLWRFRKDLIDDWIRHETEQTLRVPG